jgi:hypothetical protein
MGVKMLKAKVQLTEEKARKLVENRKFGQNLKKYQKL